MMAINQDKLVNGCGLQHSHSQNAGALPRQCAESLCACEASLQQAASSSGYGAPPRNPVGWLCRLFSPCGENTEKGFRTEPWNQSNGFVWRKHDKRPAMLPTGCEAGQNFTGYVGYWSSSPNASNSNNAWNVNFNNGNDNANNKNNNNYVRLVRSGE